MFGTAEVIIIKHVVKPLLKPCYLFVDRAVKTSTPVFAEVFRDRRQNNDVRRGVKADKEPALIIITSSQRWGGESFLHLVCRHTDRHTCEYRARILCTEFAIQKPLSRKDRPLQEQRDRSALVRFPNPDYDYVGLRQRSRHFHLITAVGMIFIASLEKIRHNNCRTLSLKTSYNYRAHDIFRCASIS